MGDDASESRTPTSGVQGWLFDRPPQDAEYTSMKPPRRLGKGLADMVGLHAGTIVTSAPADEIDDGHAAPASVLHLLSTEAEGLPGPRVVKAGAPPVTPAAVAPAPVSIPAPVSVPVPVPVPVPAPVAEAPVAVVVPPEPEREPEPVLAAPELEPEPGSGFQDEWFDPPISAFSPVGDFHRLEAAHEAPVPEPRPEPVPVARAMPEVVREAAPASLPDLSALPPAPSRIAAIPQPQPVVEPEPEPVLDDPVILDDGLFFDDVVVGNFLPDVDLDS